MLITQYQSNLAIICLTNQQRMTRRIGMTFLRAKFASFAILHRVFSTSSSDDRGIEASGYRLGVGFHGQ